MCSAKIALFKAESNDEKGDPYAQVINNQGIRAFVVPTLAFNFINDDILLEYLRSDFDGIIFTSTRSVEAVSRVWCGDFFLKWKERNSFAVGESTSRLAKSLLKLNCIGEQSGNSQELGSFILSFYKENEDGAPKRLFFPSSSKSKETINKILEENGLTVVEIKCYETSPNPGLKNCWDKIISSEGPPSIVVFFSPSGVEFSCEMMKVSYSTTSLPKFIAIGPSTEQALLNANLPVSKTACKPNPTAVWDAVKECISR